MAPLSTPSHQRADEALSFRREDPDFEKNFDSPITVVIDAGHPPPNSMPAGPLGFLFQGRQHPHAPRAPISEMASGPARESPNLHALADPSSSAPPPLATPRSPLSRGWAPFCLPPPGAVLVRRHGVGCRGGSGAFAPEMHSFGPRTAWVVPTSILWFPPHDNLHALVLLLLLLCRPDTHEAC